MKRKQGSFFAAMVVFAFFGIGLAPFALAGGTILTPYGIEFPDGTRQRTAARKWTRLLLVSPKSTPALSGTALKDALDDIDDASTSKRYLLLLEPGEYEFGLEDSLQMKSYVDIQGSGENVTFITGTNMYKNDGVVKGKDNAELRFLTVKNKGGAHYSTAISNDHSSPSLLHVTVEASQGTENRGIYNRDSSSPTMTHVSITVYGGTKSYGVENTNICSPYMKDVDIEAAGGTTNYGVYNSYSSPDMNHVTVLGEGGTGQTGYGVYNTNSYNIDINHSIISGSTNSIFCTAGSVRVGSTQLKGGPVSGTVTCAGVYDEPYNFYPSSCP